MTQSADYDAPDRVPQYVRAERTQPCPYCGAGRGEPCRTPRGRSTYTHGARSEITSDAYRIGIEEGLRTALTFIDWQVRKSGVNTTVEQIRDVTLRDFQMLAESNRRRILPPEVQ